MQATSEQAGEAILTSDKANFKTELVIQNKGDHYILLKGTVYQEDTTPLNIDIPNISVSSFIKQILVNIKGHIDPNTIIKMSDFTIPLHP